MPKRRRPSGAATVRSRQRSRISALRRRLGKGELAPILLGDGGQPAAQLVDALLHALGAAREFLVVEDLAPARQALGAGFQPADLVLLRRARPGRGDIALGQQLARPAAGCGEILNLAVAQDQRALGGAVEQRAVMADEDEGAGELVGHPGLEAEDLGEVEMIGRLVQQQEVGLGHRGARDQHQAPPAAAEGAERRRRLRLVEAEGGEDRLGPIGEDLALARRHALGHGLQRRSGFELGRQHLLDGGDDEIAPRSGAFPRRSPRGPPAPAARSTCRSHWARSARPDRPPRWRNRVRRRCRARHRRSRDSRR